MLPGRQPGHCAGCVYRAADAQSNAGGACLLPAASPHTTKRHHMRRPTTAAVNAGFWSEPTLARILAMPKSLGCGDALLGEVLSHAFHHLKSCSLGAAT